VYLNYYFWHILHNIHKGAKGRCALKLEVIFLSVILLYCDTVKGFAQKLLFRKNWPMKILKLKCHCAYHLVPAQLSTHLFTTKTQKIYSNQMIETVQFYTTDQIFNTKCFKIYIYIFPLLPAFVEKMVLSYVNIGSMN